MSTSASVRTRSFARGAFALGLISLGGCKVYDPSLVDTGPIVQECTAGSPGCIPSPPPASTSSSTDAVDMTFALRDVLLTQTDPVWRSIGFNLDGIKTPTNTSPNGCLVPSDQDGGGPSSTYPIDGLEGIDNQFGAALATTLLPAVDEHLQNDLCCMQSYGRGTILLRIRDWNGTDNDAKVTISLTTALDGTADDPASLTFMTGANNGYYNGASPASAPSWIPDTDTWYMNTSDVSSGDPDKPRHVDLNAFVRDGYFVMHMDLTQPVKLFLGHNNGIAIGLRYGTMIGHISTNRHLIDSGWIGGRMGSTELIDASYRLLAGQLYSEVALGTGTATTNDACGVIAGQVAPLLTMFGDVLADGTNDPSTQCNALSAGVAYHGVRAKEVRIGASSLVIPLPDCDGQSPIFGTAVPEEANCPFNMTTSCSIRTWSAND